MPNNIFVTLRQQYKNNDINTDSRDKINNNSKIVATGFACVVSVWTTRPFILNCPNPNFPKIIFFYHRQFWSVLIPSSNWEFVAMLNFVSTLLNQKLLSVRDLFVNTTKQFEPVLHKIFTLHTQLMRNVKISSNVLWASLFIFNPGRNLPWVLLWKSSSPFFEL